LHPLLLAGLQALFSLEACATTFPNGSPRIYKPGMSSIAGFDFIFIVAVHPHPFEFPTAGKKKPWN
jgi:hypothetical protein